MIKLIVIVGVCLLVAGCHESDAVEPPLESGGPRDTSEVFDTGPAEGQDTGIGDTDTDVDTTDTGPGQDTGTGPGPDTGSTPEGDTDSVDRESYGDDTDPPDRKYYGPCRVDWLSWQPPDDNWDAQDFYFYDDLENDRITWESWYEGALQFRLVRDEAGTVYFHQSGTPEDMWYNVSITEYDEHGNMVRSVYTNAGDTDERIIHWEYDPEGRVTEWWSETEDYIQVGTFTYDDTGSREVVEVDYDKDGIIDSRHERTYDLHGEQTGWWDDNDNDGIPEGQWVKEFTYDDEGRMVRDAYDGDADGSFNTIQMWDYNAAGDLIAYRTDIDADGTWDTVYSYVYDIDGNRISLTQYGADENITSLTESTFDAFGNELTQSTTDYDEEGAVSRTREGTFHYGCW